MVVESLLTNIVEAVTVAKTAVVAVPAEAAEAVVAETIVEAAAARVGNTTRA
jgi:hypothetical protein